MLIMTNKKDFIDLDILKKEDLRSIINIAKKLKSINLATKSKLLEFKNLVMIFEKNSTRTRISFEAGINQLGGNAIVMDKNSTQLSKGEPVPDTAKVLSGMVDMVMIRCKDHNLITEMAGNSTIPVINGLTDYSHPCQIMASILTIEEKLGNIENKKLSWFGDVNNVLISYIHGASKFNYQLDIAVPKNFDSCNEEIKQAQKEGAKINLYHDPKKAATNSDVLITDTWISMGDESDNSTKKREEKIKLLMPYQVNQELMSLAKDRAIFTHCLPAYRDFEVTSQVIDSKQSVIFEEAHNRLPIQQAIMLWLNDITILDLNKL
jgi:ornithine carbamoyltransferase